MRERFWRNLALLEAAAIMLGLGVAFGVYAASRTANALPHTNASRNAPVDASASSSNSPITPVPVATPAETAQPVTPAAPRFVLIETDWRDEASCYRNNLCTAHAVLRNVGGIGNAEIIFGDQVGDRCTTVLPVTPPNLLAEASCSFHSAEEGLYMASTPSGQIVPPTATVQ